MKEIEKRFLLRALPQGIVMRIKIRQGYINIGPQELRVRQQGEDFYFTLKSGDGFSRDEIDSQISKKLFKKLWPFTKQKRIAKIRHILFHDGLTWEIDEIFRGFRRLIIAEVELPSEETSFTIPLSITPLIIADITEDLRYRNKTLATQGFPK